MTQEEIQLLIQDICARLQSGLICSIYREDDEGFGWRDAKCKGYFQNNGSYEFYFDDVITVDNIERLKPYLRPLSSMTEEEFDEIKRRWVFTEDCRDENDLMDVINRGTIDTFDAYSFIDWLNKKYFDYRGLIEKGLAIEASEEMYNTKIE
jgi:hypothetical protein